MLDTVKQFANTYWGAGLLGFLGGMILSGMVNIFDRVGMLCYGYYWPGLTPLGFLAGVLVSLILRDLLTRFVDELLLRRIMLIIIGGFTGFGTFIGCFMGA